MVSNIHNEIITKAFELFNPGSLQYPPMTLRAANEVDSYGSPMPFDPELDRITDDYFRKYFWGIAHLDPDSWKFYLPYMIEYALGHMTEVGLMPVESLLSSLRPPDREPPRLASLSRNQEEVVGFFLDVLAFDENSAYQDYAMQVLEEYWIPNALYRKRE